MEHSELNVELVLSMSVKAMNDTAGPEGLDPTLLDFGALPKAPELFKSITSQMERFRAIETAKAKFNKAVNKSRMSRAINKAPPPASNYRFEHRQPVHL